MRTVSRVTARLEGRLSCGWSTARSRSCGKDADLSSLRSQVSLKEENRISHRLGADRGVKSHRIAGRCGDASIKGGGLEGLRLAVYEQGRPLRPEQDQRTFFRADEVWVEARGGGVRECPCVVS